MSVTIHDVAKKAGCSIKTVSRVMNQEAHVRPSLREKVLAAVEELGYIPNISARSLVQKRTFRICFLLHASGSFRSSLISKLLDLGYEGDYEILIQTYYPSFSRSRAKISQLINQRKIDGLIATPPCDSDPFLWELISNTEIPSVLISPLNPTGGKPYVSAEDYSGAYQMTQFLGDLGHNRIGLLMGLRNHRSSLDRMFGFRAALEDRGIAFDDQLAINSENNFDGGYTAVKILMNLPEPPSAIFALSDESAAGALYALNELELKVPQDISLVSFGDMGLSDMVWPGITVIKYPIEAIVEKSVEMLIQLIENETLPSQQVIFPTRLVVRGSTAERSGI